MTDIHQTIKLAREFGHIVQRDFSTSEFRRMVDLNKAETDQDICHTHDFCDANMLMDEAFRKVVGRGSEPDSDADAELWSNAWTIAKAADFFA